MSDEYDSPWKIILERYFQDFMAFFFPEYHDEIDWSRGYESLDTELQQIVRDAATGKRLADKLIKVWRLDGEEQWVLIHVEVQGHYDANMAERMFTYHYRLHDAHQKPIVSLAVLGDDDPNWRPTRYEKQFWGCQVRFDFPIIKLIDYQAQLDSLASDKNPFAWIVLTHLQTGATRKDPQARLRWKFELVKQLYQKGYKRSDILELFRFLDWLLALPKALELRFQQQYIEYEATMSRPYVSNIERRWMKEAAAMIEEGKAEAAKVKAEAKAEAAKAKAEAKAEAAEAKAEAKAEAAKAKAEAEAEAEAKAEAKAENLHIERRLLRRLTHSRLGEHAAEQLSVLFEQINDSGDIDTIGAWIIDSQSVQELQARLEGMIRSQD